MPYEKCFVQNGAIAGDSEVSGINQPKLHGRKDGKEEKELLEGSFRIIAGRRAVHDPIYNICCGEGSIIVFYKFNVGSDNLVRLFGVPAGRKEAGPCGSAVKEQDKNDEGTENLGLVLCETSGSGIKAGDEISNGIKVKAQELLVLLFIGFEAVLWVAGKASAVSPDKGSILVVALP